MKEVEEQMHAGARLHDAGIEFETQESEEDTQSLSVFIGKQCLNANFMYRSFRVA